MVNPTTVTVNRPTSLLRNLPTRAEWRLLYATTAIPVHLWALLLFFYSLPSYLMRMNIWTMLGILAYVLALALLESILVSALLALIALVLPYRFFKQYCVPQGVLTILLLTAWLIPAHFALVSTTGTWLSPSLDALLPSAWLISLAGGLISGSLLLRRRPGLARSLTSLAERFTLLSTVYLVLDLCGLAAVILRLLF